MTARNERYTTPDLWFTEDGDFVIDDNGDLKDTQSSPARAIIQEVTMILNANRGEWILYPKMGANLSDLIGLNNSEKMGVKAVEKITEALTDSKILTIDEFRVIPMVIDTYLIIRVIVFGPLGEVSVNFGYDSDKKRFIGY